MTDPRGGSPVIDVLIPVKAPAPWFGEALHSVVAQSTTSWRLLVIMDGFSQEVQAVCDALPEGTPIQVEVLPTGSGLVPALNHGLQVSRAEFIARLDADDLCHPERFARQLDYLRRTPECVALGTGVELVDEHGTPCGTRAVRQAGSIMRTLRWRCPLAHPSVMMRRPAAARVGGYSPTARHAEDYDLWLRLATIGEIHAIPDTLLQYRIHGGQVTANVAFSRETEATLRRSRTDLASQRAESAWAAKTRHSIWLAVNIAKGRGR